MTQTLNSSRMTPTHPTTVTTSHLRVGVLGLGYVGLPLAIAFGQQRETLGYDIDPARIDALNQGYDATRESSVDELSSAKGLRFSHDPEALRACNCFIVTVPTPIDAHKHPDLGPLLSASETVGRMLKPGDLVIYESTVYPGATEEECVPVLEKASGLRFNRDFFCGYSPERINPGDTQKRLTDITKVTSGSTPEIGDLVDALYQEIITAGTHKAPSIRVAEAAKVIENTQRDLNIALMNELSMIFRRMGLETREVLSAAATKWNFLPFKPGLVGGHCIGVDPYYLTHKAQSLGYDPEIILAGRRINDGMSDYVVNQLIKAMIQRRIEVHGARVLVMGITFKENCRDLRNSKMIDVVRSLEEYGILIDIMDPFAPEEMTKTLCGHTPITNPPLETYDAVVLALAHHQFMQMEPKVIRSYCTKKGVVFDLKEILAIRHSDLRL